MQQHSDTEQKRIRTVALLACLAVVATMFFAAILTGIVSLAMDKDQAGSGMLRSDQP